MVFAAELGPRALVGEWVKLDKTGFDAAVASVPTYFPTREKWDEACDELKEMRESEPLSKFCRRLLASCGNALGCALLEEGKSKSEKGKSAEAWEIFTKVANEVERDNYTALLNLIGMVSRGYAVPKDEQEALKNRRQQVEQRLKTWEAIIAEARSGGRLYVDPKAREDFETKQREAAAAREPTPEEQRFVEAVSAASKDPESGKAAREAIRKAISEGKVRLDRIGGELITIDSALGDTESMEKDSLAVLRLNRHDPTANAVIGLLNSMREDYEAAERYLRRAVGTGRASILAKNDLAYTLMKLGRAEEAEPFAREALKAAPQVWEVRETLVAILIAQRRMEEAEREFAEVERLVEKRGIPKGRIPCLEIDRARIQKAKGDRDHFKMTMRALKNRTDLTPGQRKEVERMDW